LALVVQCNAKWLPIGLDLSGSSDAASRQIACRNTREPFGFDQDRQLDYHHAIPSPAIVAAPDLRAPGWTKDCLIMSAFTTDENDRFDWKSLDVQAGADNAIPPMDRLGNQS
jgi:hypothetical protein